MSTDAVKKTSESHKMFCHDLSVICSVVCVISIIAMAVIYKKSPSKTPEGKSGLIAAGGTGSASLLLLGTAQVFKPKKKEKTDIGTTPFVIHNNIYLFNVGREGYDTHFENV